MDYLPPVALVAVLAGVWGWARWSDRRFRKTMADAAPRLKGRYDPKGPPSGGNLFGQIGDRSVVIGFVKATSSNPEATSISIMLRRPVKEPLHWKGADAVARIPELGPYSRGFHSAELRVESNLLTARIDGILRDAGRLVALAEAVASRAAPFDS